jgi:hypothetical protein
MRRRATAEEMAQVDAAQLPECSRRGLATALGAALTMDDLWRARQEQERKLAEEKARGAEAEESALPTCAGEDMMPVVDE